MKSYHLEASVMHILDRKQEGFSQQELTLGQPS